MVTGSVKRIRISRAGRLAIGAVLAAAIVVGVATSVGAGGSADEYVVRANFLNSSGITTGADVRVAGANVGSIKKIYVNSANQSSVVMAITDPAFQKFYTDATCRVRLQSLIGEKFIDCDPGTPTKEELPPDPTKEGRRLLSSKHTRSPVDIDELLDAMREPERERFRIIMNELGITLTGRGQDLQDIIKRFDPTFKEIDDVLKILARQNRNLVRLAEDGDAVLREYAANKEHITGFMREADKTSRAVNAKRAELAETLARLPAFLDELEPTARELKTLSEEAAPVARSARLSAKNLSTFVSNTNDFVREANPALKKLGDSLDVFRAQIPVLQPIAADLRTFVGYRSSVTNIRKLLESFDEQGGYMNLASMAYGIATAANGFDAFGHFMRSGLVVNSICLFYAPNSAATDCTASFAENRTESNSPQSQPQAGSSARAARASGERAALDYLLGGER